MGIIKTKDGFIIEDTHWFGGLAPGFHLVDQGSGPGVNNLKFGPEGSYANSKGVNPFANFGPITPGSELTDLTNVSDISNNISAALVSDVSGAQKAYALEAGTKLHEITYTTNTITSAGGFPHTITAHGGHSTVVGSDLAFYDIGGTKYVFYSWNDSTDGDVGRLNLGGSTFDDDFMSTVPANAAALGTGPHILVPAENGFMYITSLNSIHKFDGTTGANGTLTASVIDLPLGWEIVDAISYRGFLWIGAVYLKGVGNAVQRDVAIYVWNFSSTSSFADIIYIDAIDFIAFDIDNSKLDCFTISKDHRCDLRRYTGKEFTLLEQYSIDHRPNNKHSITKYRGMKVWLAQNETLTDDTIQVISYGKPHPNFSVGSAKPFAFASKEDGSAFFETISGAYYLGTRVSSGGNYKLSRISGTFGSAELYSRVYELPANSQIDWVNIFFEPISGSITKDLTMKLYKNQSASSFKTLTIDGNVDTANVSRGFKHFDLSTRMMQAYQYEIEFPNTTDYKVTRVQAKFSLTEQET